jgi:hypothetical protein
VIRTRAVSRLTTVSLLRVRYLLYQPERAPLLSEEVLVAACTDGSAPGTHQWLADAEALRLLAEARPDANVPMAEKRALVTAALEAWPTHEVALRERIKSRAAELETNHKRVRRRSRSGSVNSLLLPSCRRMCWGFSSSNRWSDYGDVPRNSYRRRPARA